MTAPMPHLLFAAFLLLLDIAVATLLMLRVQRRQRLYLARVGSVVSPHLRVQDGGAAARRAPAANTLEPLLRRAAALFGFDPDRAEHYPLRWWVVLPAALVLARLLALLLDSLVGWIAVLGVLPLWIVLCRAFFGWAEARRAQKLYAQFPDALSMIVRGVRVGIPVTEAVKGIGRDSPSPTAEEFRILADQLAIGMALDTALRELADRNRLAEYRFFATALSLQAQTGGGLSETLENLADVIRKRVAMRHRGQALASEARTSIFILASLPVFSGLALAFLNRSYIATLFTDPTGRKILATAVISLGLGIATMQTMVRKSLT